MAATKITLPAHSFRRIATPAEAEGKRLYTAIIAVCDLPKSWENWQEINPAPVQRTDGVAKKMADSLQNEPQLFLFKNRGITISAEQVAFDNKTGEMHIEFSDPAIHGLLDGRMTYAVLRERLEEVSGGFLEEAFIRLEILEGFLEKEELVGIADARNLSIQRSDKLSSKMRGLYDAIRASLANEACADRVAYRESELNGEKDVDIKDILSCLICFDSEGFDGRNHPMMVCESKTEVMAYAEKEGERLKKYIPLLPQILRLRDEIYELMPVVYEKNGARFSALNGVSISKTKSVELPFSRVRSEYFIPNSFLYPVLAALRSLAAVSDGKAVWKTEPSAFLHKISDELIGRLCEQARELRDPVRLGKSKMVWCSCFDCAAMEALKAGM